MNTVEKLNLYADIKAQGDVLQLQKAELIKAATPEIPAEVQQRLDEIEAEFSGKLEALTANLATLEAEIKAEVIAGGATVKADFYQAVYAKGRTSWDTKSLDGYAVAHPEILTMRTVGSPSVSFRKVS